MKKSLIIITIVALLAALTSGCALEAGQSPDSPAQEQETASLINESTTSTQIAATPAENESNFRILVSDEVNAIEEFQSLNVTISHIGVHQSGGSGNWTEYDLDQAVTVDLTELQGVKATEIWNFELEQGTYTKVFIYVDNVTGVLKDNPEGAASVKLPGGKLQISKSFDVAEDGMTDFIFDITVIKAGNSGKYILKPQVAESGPHQHYIEVEPKGKTEQKGKPEDKGKSRGKNNDSSGNPEVVEIADTIAPVITVSGVSNGDNITGNVTISFEVSDDTDPEPAVNATLNNAPFVSGTEISGPGVYELIIKAVDSSGNEAEVTIEFEIKQE
jgi:hypothetical protein